MIKSITIRNFKSIRDLTVDLSPVTVLVGRSGSGKSTFLQAIEFVRNFVRGKGRSEEVANYYAPFGMGYKRGDDAEFVIHFNMPGYPDDFRYLVRMAVPDRNVVRLQEESLSLGDNIVYEQHVTPATGHQLEWGVPPKLTEIPKAGALRLGEFPGIEEATSAYAYITAGIGVYRFPLNVMQKTNGQGQHERYGLDDFGGNYLTALQALTLRMDQASARRSLLATMQRLNRTVRSIELESLQELKGAIVGHTLGELIMPLRLEDESDGFRRCFAHLLALYQQPPKQVLLFEEPENGIYPGALELLGEEFRAAPDAGRGQVILTTHNPRLLDQFDPDQIRVVELDDAMQTQIGPLVADQREAIREHLLSPGELLDVDPARREVAVP